MQRAAITHRRDYSSTAFMNSKHAPIGIFDSGVGGLSVLGAIRQQFPCEDMIFLADQGHVPYGPRPMSQVQDFSEGVTRYLLSKGAKLIVVACNTASAAALHHLRNTFLQTPFVGMEPAVKPAAEGTQSGVVGVLATPATFQGELYASVVERFAQGVTVLQDVCPGLVTQIEKGELDTPRTRAILGAALTPMRERGVDRVVMGCTHYPFVIPLIQEILGPDVEVINPAPAVARQAGRLLDIHRLRTPKTERGKVQYLTTGDAAKLEAMLPQLIGEGGTVQSLRWVNGALETVP